ncbi:hypothetical protein EDD85DRAFT_397633 [Armillaria nabsnona]|nr:hypothetical protein EDD85DRAFT_397633 [Armillaria nabsnona]
MSLNTLLRRKSWPSSIRLGTLAQCATHTYSSTQRTSVELMSLLAAACKWNLWNRGGQRDCSVDSERGVVLFMRDVTFTTLPFGKPWAHRLERHTSESRDKAIVTETYSCRHYDLRMGRADELCRRIVLQVYRLNLTGEHSVEIAGTAEIPIPAAPALSASANVGFKTARKAGFGSAWHGTTDAETESDGFVPLYRLKAFTDCRPCSLEQPDEWVIRDVDPPGYKPPRLVWRRWELQKDGKYIVSSDEEGASKDGSEDEASEEAVIRTLRYMPALQHDDGVVYNIPALDFGMPGPPGELDKNGKDIISSDKKGSAAMAARRRAARRRRSAGGAGKTRF